jgi:hypothetical protein
MPSSKVLKTSFLKLQKCFTSSKLPWRNQDKKNKKRKREKEKEKEKKKERRK